MVARFQVSGWRFIWGDREATHNTEKYGVDFVDAGAVFDDSRGMLFADKLYLDGECRYCLLGYDVKDRLLCVGFCYREGGTPIRLISARIASREERRAYFHDGR